MQPRWTSDGLNLWQNEKLSWTHTACFFILHLRFSRFSCVFFSLRLYPILLASLLAQKCFCPCTLRLFMPTSLRNDGKKTNIHVQSNVHHIFKHISKSSDFEIISQNKSIFFSQPIRYLYLDCTIYVYMSNHEGPKQQK